MPEIEPPKLTSEEARSTAIEPKELDDPRFRIRPLQQVASACTGALITACFSKNVQ